MANLKDIIRNLLLRIALPRKQYYIQCDGFHSVFKPIIRPLFDVMEDDDGEGNENNNRG